MNRLNIQCNKSNYKDLHNNFNTGIGNKFIAKKKHLHIQTSYLIINFLKNLQIKIKQKSHFY